MTLQEVQRLLNAQVIIAPTDPQMELKMGLGCDLLSDVLSFGTGESVLLTGLTNPQVVRTAEIADIKALVFVRGKAPDRETIALAKEKNIPILLTDLPMYEACGRLYRAGLPGRFEAEKGRGQAHDG